MTRYFITLILTIVTGSLESLYAQNCDVLTAQDIASACGVEVTVKPTSVEVAGKNCNRKFIHKDASQWSSNQLLFIATPREDEAAAHAAVVQQYKRAPGEHNAILLGERPQDGFLVTFSAPLGSATHIECVFALGNQLIELKSIAHPAEKEIHRVCFHREQLERLIQRMRH